MSDATNLGMEAIAYEVSQAMVPGLQKLVAGFLADRPDMEQADLVSNVLQNLWRLAITATTQVPELKRGESNEERGEWWGGVQHGVSSLMGMVLADTYCCDRHMVEDAMHIAQAAVNVTPALVAQKAAMGQAPASASRH